MEKETFLDSSVLSESKSLIAYMVLHDLPCLPHLISLTPFSHSTLPQENLCTGYSLCLERCCPHKAMWLSPSFPLSFYSNITFSTRPIYLIKGLENSIKIQKFKREKK